VLIVYCVVKVRINSFSVSACTDMYFTLLQPAECGD